MVIGRTDYPTGNVHDMMQSLKRLLELIDGVKICPGHGVIGYRNI